MTQLTWTYDALTAALQNFLDDYDPDWVNTTTLPQLVYLGEMKIVQDLDLTLFDMSATITLTAGVGENVIARPTGILFTDDMLYAQASGQPNPGKLVTIERRDMAWLLDYLDPNVKGPPLYYAEQDVTNYCFAPYADVNYTVTTFGPYAHQSLNDVNPESGTTWLSTNVADLLLGACMLEGSRFLKNQGKRTVEMDMYQQRLVAMKVRMRSLRRDTLEQPRTTGATAPEGALPSAAQSILVQPTTVQS